MRSCTAMDPPPHRGPLERAELIDIDFYILQIKQRLSRPLDLLVLLMANNYVGLANVGVHQDLSEKCVKFNISNVSSMLFLDSGGDAPVPSSMLFPDSGFRITTPPIP